MRVTLKRADSYARAALKAATETKHDVSMQVSIYAPELAEDGVIDTSKLQTIVTAARNKVLEEHDLSLALIEAAYTIRSQLAEANTRAGISLHLTRNAQLGVEEGRVRSLLKTFETKVETNLQTVLSKSKALRENTTSDHYGLAREDSVKVGVMQADDEDRLRKMLKRIVDERININDLLTAANVSNQIELDAATVATLRRGDVLPE